MDEQAADRVGGGDPLERLVAMSRELADSEGLDATLQHAVDLSEDHLDDCDGASLMIVQRGGRVSSPAFSSELAREGDQAQYAADEGPCLAAIREQEAITIDDLASDDRWPAFRDRASELGVGSMVCFRLFVSEDTLGAWNLYSRRPHAFDERSKAVGRVFASHAAVAMKSAISVAGLTAALESRDVIGQAKGIIMEREDLTAGEAFERLRELSQTTNRRLRDVAADIAGSGVVPDASGE